MNSIGRLNRKGWASQFRTMATATGEKSFPRT